MSVEAVNFQGRIIVAVDDMFFAAKILGAAQTIGRVVERAKSAEQINEALKKDRPALLIIDLNSTQFNALEMITSIKSHAAYSTLPIIGFLSHVQVELKRGAEQAGCDFVMPRSAFAQALAEILSGRLPITSAKPS